MTTGSDLVVQELKRRGGTAPRAEILGAVTIVRGRRDAGRSIALAVLFGYCCEVVLPCGRVGLSIRAASADAAAGDGQDLADATCVPAAGWERRTRSTGVAA